MPFQSVPFSQPDGTGRETSQFGVRTSLLVAPGPHTLLANGTTGIWHHPLGMGRAGKYAHAGDWDADWFTAPDGVTPVINPMCKMVTPPALAAGDRIYIGRWHEGDFFRNGAFTGRPDAATGFQGWTTPLAIRADYYDWSALDNGGTTPTLRTITLMDEAIMTGSLNADLDNPFRGSAYNRVRGDLWIYAECMDTPVVGDQFHVSFDFNNLSANK